MKKTLFLSCSFAAANHSVSYFSLLCKESNGILGEPSADVLLSKIESEKDNSLSNDEFLKEFREGRIDVFDHRAHLRIGFIILFRCAKESISPSNAVDQFIQVLRSFFSLADKSKIRPTFHLTMTILWCHVINLALVEFIDKTPENELNETEEKQLFVIFLKSFPILMWSGLWTKYYSKDKLMSPNAKENYIIPDVAPFPAYMTLQGASTSSKLRNDSKDKIDQTLKRNQELSDDDFYNCFDECSLNEFDELSLMRICLLKLNRNKNERRATIVAQIMENLQRLLLRVRVRDTNAIVFSYTQTYFWIQIMNVALVSLEYKKSENQSDEITFHSFVSLFPELLPASKPWKQFYSEKLFNSMEARRVFVTPDLKQLPNFIRKVQVSDGSLVSLTDVLSRRPSLLILKQVQQKLLDVLEPVPTLDVELVENAPFPADCKGYQLNDEALIFSIRCGKLDNITHFDLLRMIFLHVNQGWERGERGTVAVTRIVDHLECYWEIKKSPTIIREENVSPLSVDTIFFHLFSNRFTNQYSGLTHIHFWIQMVIASMVKATHANPKCLLNFSDFLGAFPELLWDKLWSIYYSELICFSPEAKAMVIPADLLNLPAFLSNKSVKN